MSDKRKEFFKLNSEYQKCLNDHYDKFLEGKDVKLDNEICADILKKMKETGDFYQKMHKEFQTHLKTEEKSK
jgi:hypothetical protein